MTSGRTARSLYGWIGALMALLGFAAMVLLQSLPTSVRGLIGVLSGVLIGLSWSRIAWAGADERTRENQLAQRNFLLDLERSMADSIAKLTTLGGEKSTTLEQATHHTHEISRTVQELMEQVDSLASTAHESNISISQVTTTHTQVSENIGSLTSSVRETVSSIEEMASSIKEVARNVDALSLTTEETSISMNQMDLSIDQVQSNANETARLSEEVAVDAQRGAEAISRTINEINRIKESSSEAVSVIFTLGSRIDAIGDILGVIDDVAEQTNLLALNAAIIAAQAGEHGKGFAVVADEIKDLADRAGTSTKEIADLIKTVQAESKNAVTAVERGAHTVDRGVEVSAEAERTLKKILESSQKSTSMVGVIAKATLEQAKGSKQVTDAIGRIAETVQQIAVATAEQAKGSELIMKSAEKMRTITQQVERSFQDQVRGGKLASQGMENILGMIQSLQRAQREQLRGSDQLLGANSKIVSLMRETEAQLRVLSTVEQRVRVTLEH